MKKTLDNRVERVLKVIEAKNLSPVELRNLYRNVISDERIDESDRDLIVSKMESKLRKTSSKLANTLFGPKDSMTRMMLEDAYNTVQAHFNLDANQVRNGVKTGGDMIAGRAHIYVYISYKNSENWHVSLSLYQLDVDSSLRCRIRRYNTSKESSVCPEMYESDASEFDTMLSKYILFLSEICPAKIKD